MLATVQIPEGDGSVVTATGQPGAIGTHLERVHRPLMRLLHPYAMPAVNLPPAQHAITASTDQQLPTRTPGHCSGCPGMPRQGSHTFPALRLPHEELPTSR